MSRDYAVPMVNGITNGSPSVIKTNNTSAEYSNNSLLSNQTYDTYVSSNVTTTYIENSCHSISTNSQDGSSQLSLLNGQSPANGSQNTIAVNLMDFPDEYLGGIPEVVEFDGYRLIFQGEIGRV